MENKVQTDIKLLTIMQGGLRMAMTVDPEGLLSNMRPTRLAYDRENETWSLTFSDEPNGKGQNHVTLNGWKIKSKYVLHGIAYKDGTGKNAVFSTKAKESLNEAVSPVSALPVHLKRSLASTGLISRENETERFVFEEYFTMLEDALLFGVERHKEKDTLERFSRYIVKYQYNDKGIPVMAEFQTTYVLEEGEISLTANADILGLGGKKALMKKNLGMLRSASVSCTSKKDGRTIPSLLAAFDLYDKIPKLYEDERIERLDKQKERDNRQESSPKDKKTNETKQSIKKP